MNMRKIIFVLVIWFLLLPQTLKAQQKVAVAIMHSGSDIVGQRLVDQLKERIRKSVVYKISTLKDARLLLALSSTDIFPERPGVSSAIGYSIATLAKPQLPFPILLGNYVMICGADVIGKQADTIIATIDKEIDNLVSLYKELRN